MSRLLGGAPSSSAGERLAHGHCTLHPALAAGLAADLAAWPARSITRHAMDASSRDPKLRESDITALFGIYNNTLYWLSPASHPRPRNPHLYAVADDLAALLLLHRVPDVEFRLNVDDYPKAKRAVPTGVAAADGAPPPRVPLPLFSYTKRSGHAEHDVLVPSGAFRMGGFEGKLRSRSPSQWASEYPWEGKARKAYFRGTPYCGVHKFGRCSRYVIPRLAHENRSSHLDVGLVEYNPRHDTELLRDPPAASGPLRKAERRPEADLPKFAFLLHMDGHSFSNRLQTLLLTNSLVLKQQSRFQEYYYRALEPWVHYVPFYERSPTDLLDILPNLTRADPAADSTLRAIARRGQAFAHGNLHLRARMCYWRHLLQGWSRRLAYTPTLGSRPAARTADGHYVCGECRRPPNPELIGPWEGKALAERRGAERRAQGAQRPLGPQRPEAETVPTNYADVTLIHAHNALLRAALAEPTNAKFVSLSQACIPLKPFAHVHAVLTADDTSRFGEFEPSECWESGRCAPLRDGGVPKEVVSKAANWWSINRSLAALALSTPTTHYHSMRSPEEHFYLTTARMANTDEPPHAQPPGDGGGSGGGGGGSAGGMYSGLVTVPITYANWSSREARPKTYTTLSFDELHALVHSPHYLFARKFDAGCDGLEPLREMHRGAARAVSGV